MEENKESMEQTAPEENTEQISIAESEKLGYCGLCQGSYRSPGLVCLWHADQLLVV